MQVGGRRLSRGVSFGNSLGLLGALAMAAAIAAMTPALASLPVARTLVGCVVNGAFVTSDGYVIDPNHPDGRKVDLRSFEGRRIRMGGALLPGDRFIVKQRPLDLGACRTSPRRVGATDNPR